MIASLGKNWDNRDKSKVLTIGFHVLLLLLALWPFLHVAQWTEEKGVMVEFSEIVINEPESQRLGSSNDQPPSPETNKAIATAPVSIEKQVEEVKRPEAVVEEVSEVKKVPVVSKPSTESSDHTSRSFTNLFKSNGTAETTSDPGNPNVSALEGLSSVTSSEVGEGLSGRQIVFTPEIEDNSQRAGRVVVRICVDQKGKVISSEYTQRGSSTTDRYLVDKAVVAARQWRFSTSELAKQCGLITIDFELK